MRAARLASITKAQNAIMPSRKSSAACAIWHRTLLLTGISYAHKRVLSPSSRRVILVFRPASFLASRGYKIGCGIFLAVWRRPFVYMFGIIAIAHGLVAARRDVSFPSLAILGARMAAAYVTSVRHDRYKAR